MIPLNNFVEIEIAQATQPISIGGEEFLMDNSWEPGLRVISEGTITGVPHELYTKDDFPEGMEWTAVLDVKVGDHVWFQKYEAVRALGRLADPYMSDFEDNSTFVAEEDSVKIFIPYSSLFCVKRDDKIIMLNGFVLLEPVKREFDSSFDRPYDLNEANFGRVIEVGHRNLKYDFHKYNDVMNISKGDIVIFKKNNNFEHSDMDNRVLFKVQRNNIVGKIIND